MALNLHHKRAVFLLAGVAAADIIAGLLMAAVQHVPAWHGIYCTFGITTTNGCDLAYGSGKAYVIASVAMILFVPLWAGVFSLLTAGLTADHVDRRHAELTGRSLFKPVDERDDNW
jgi:hypothetical protein